MRKEEIKFKEPELEKAYQRALPALIKLKRMEKERKFRELES